MAMWISHAYFVMGVLVNAVISEMHQLESVRN